MEEIYHYIAIQLQAPENAMGQYNRIAEAIEGLRVFPASAVIKSALSTEGVLGKVTANGIPPVRDI